MSKMFKNNKHIIISGGRQCGKNYLMKELMKELDRLDECCAFVEIQDGCENSYLIKCPHCNGTNLTKKNYDYIESIVAEYDYYCEDCKKVVAHWSYGRIEI